MKHQAFFFISFSLKRNKRRAPHAGANARPDDAAAADDARAMTIPRRFLRKQPI